MRTTFSIPSILRPLRKRGQLQIHAPVRTSVGCPHGATPSADTWREKTGDDPRWADAPFGDSAWNNVEMPCLSRPGVHGYTWHRIPLQLPTAGGTPIIADGVRGSRLKAVRLVPVGAVAKVAAFYNKRAEVENPIKESNNDAGLTAYPSRIWAMNVNHFQLRILAYNLNCWLALFQREGTATEAELTHWTMATMRQRMLFWRHVGQTGNQMRKPLPGAGIGCKANGYGPVVPIPLRA